MIILGIDPGPRTCGVVYYDSDRREIPPRLADGCASESKLDDILFKIGFLGIGVDLVAVERLQSCGQSGADLFQTCEVVGRIQQRTLDAGLPVILLYRREVLRALDVTGIGNRDAMVHQRLLEMHGGSRPAAVGTKKAPGPLYGITGHAWQALAVAVAASYRPEPSWVPVALASGLGCGGEGT